MRRVVFTVSSLLFAGLAGCVGDPEEAGGAPPPEPPFTAPFSYPDTAVDHDPQVVTHDMPNGVNVHIAENVTALFVTAYWECSPTATSCNLDVAARAPTGEVVTRQPGQNEASIRVDGPQPGHWWVGVFPHEDPAEIYGHIEVDVQVEDGMRAAPDEAGPG